MANLIQRLFGFAATPPMRPEPEVVKPEDADRRIVSIERSMFGGSADMPRYNPDELVRKKGLQVYAKMRLDEQVKAVCVFKRDAVLSRGWVFEFDPESSLSEKEQKQRVRVFQQVVARMPGSFIDALNVISTGREYGFSLTEKVYVPVQVDGKAYVGLEGLYGRDPTMFEFHTDEYGLLKRLEQVVGGRRIELDIAKFVHYVHNPEFDRYFGQSELREAYRSWFMKDVLLRYWGIYMEKLGGGMVVASISAEAGIRAGTKEYTALQQVLANMKATAGVAMPPGVTAEVFFPTSSDAFERACQYHDAAIAKALLVPSIGSGVGASDQKSGTGAQSQTQLEAFAWTVRADTDRLESCIDEQLFRDLGDQNWGDGEYPRFRFKPLSTDGLKYLVATWADLAQKGVVIPTEDDEDRLREILEMPPRTEKSKTLQEVKQELMPQPPGMPGTPGAPSAGAPPKPPGAQPLKPAAEEKPVVVNNTVTGGGVTLEQVERVVARTTQEVLGRFAYNPDQDRDERGRWGSGGAGGADQADDAREGDTSVGVYHTTAKARVDSVKRDGLSADGGDVRLAADFQSARSKAQEIVASGKDAVVLHFRVPRAVAERMSERGVQGSGALRMQGKIPGQYLRKATVYTRQGDRVLREDHEFAALNVVDVFCVVPVERKATMRVVAHTPTGEPRVASKAAFTRAVMRVDFSVIEAKMTVMAHEEAKGIARLAARAVKRVLDPTVMPQLLDDDVRDIADLRIDGTDVGKIKNAMKQALQRGWEVGQDQARREMSKAGRPVKFAALRENAGDYFDANGFRMAGNLTDAMKAIIQAELLQAVKKGTRPEDAAAQIYARLIDKGMTTLEAVQQELLDDELEDRVERLLQNAVTANVPAYLNTLVRTNTFEALNEARYAEFTDPALSDFVLAFEYSAILDDVTTEICRHLDNRVYAADNQLWDEYRPPNHYNCRSLLIPVTAIDGWDGNESEPPRLEPAVGFRRDDGDAQRFVFNFNPDQARDDRGRWTDSGGGISKEDADRYTAYAPKGKNASVSHYKTEGYRAINEGLRRGKAMSAADKAAINGLDKLIDNSPLPHDVTMYRGVSGEFAQRVASMKEGSDFVDHGYTSWSVDSGKAGEFSSDVVLKLNAKKGWKAAPLDGHSKLLEGHEYEYLAQRGNVFIVDKITRIGGKTVVEVSHEDPSVIAKPKKFARCAVFHTPGGHDHDQSTHGGGGGGVRDALKDRKSKRSGEDSIMKNVAALPEAEREAAYAHMQHVFDATGDIDATMRAMESKIRWSGDTWSTAVDEWDAAKKAGGNGLEDKRNALERSRVRAGDGRYHLPSLTENEYAAIAARREWEQAMFREKYGESVEVYRGVRGKYAEGITGDEADVPVYSLSSWTTDRASAEGFMKKSGKLLARTVKAEDVWMLPGVGVKGTYDGYGALRDNEKEIVVLNKRPTERVRVVR